MKPKRLSGANVHLGQDARRVLTRALAKGLVKRSERCERCNAEPLWRTLHGHHADYARPLDVEWLCEPCHGKAHNVGPIDAPGGVRESFPREEQDAMMADAKENRERLNERKPHVLRYGSARWLATGRGFV